MSLDPRRGGLHARHSAETEETENTSVGDDVARGHSPVAEGIRGGRPFGARFSAMFTNFGRPPTLGSYAVL
ncbi:hypothetical protein PAL_GLEAN10013315 [Pteropus alecto]|uniref:Uncharacterized protein n=1 Tax=Pteropus alecto TaxID=9402 RepID=L5KEK7_PTEAL|nr:hypothetical protein PAL_GLEAN10013315 [Pteropus alecto]